MARDKSQNPLEYEIQAEKAASLARVASKMEEVLAALRDLDRELAGTSEAPAEMRELRASRLAEAAEWVWYYVVQREAMGMRDHAAAFALYEVPSEVLRRLGPRPKLKT